MSLFTPESGITDDKSFVLSFWDSESILLLPSSCFAESNFFRVVTCISKENADEFALRLERFLQKNTIKQEESEQKM
jgi:aspartate/methionine/tyrosine aminotransferase